MKKTSDVLRLFAVVSIGIGSLGDAISFGQDERSKPESQIQIQQIESEITVYGKKNRFAAIGSATSLASRVADHRQVIKALIRQCFYVKNTKCG